MHPINKEFLTPQELHVQADILEGVASKHLKKGLLNSFRDLLDRAAGKRRHAQRLMDAADLRENAVYLEQMRSVKTATTLDPYGEGIVA